MKTLPTFCVVLLTVFLVLTNQRINAMEKKKIRNGTKHRQNQNRKQAPPEPGSIDRNPDVACFLHYSTDRL